MTKDLLLKRKQDLDSSFELAIAKANSIEGMLRECDYWLKVIEDEEIKEQAKQDNDNQL